MKQFKDTIELIGYIQRNMEANPGIPFDAFLMEMGNRGDTIDGAPIQDIVNGRDGWYEDVKAKCEGASNSVDLSGHDETVFSTEEPEPEVEEDKKTIYNSRNYDALKDFVEKYNDLVKQKEEKLSEYNNFKGYNEKTGVIDKGKQEIEDINTQLKEMEDGDEFKEILQSIKDYGLGDKWNEDDSWLRYGVDNIINKRGSAIEKNNALKKFFMGSNMVSNTYKNMDELIDGFLGGKSDTKKEKQLNPEFVEKNKDNEKLNPEFRKKLQEQYNKQKGNKDTKMQSSIGDKEVTDNMKFGNDVTSKDYLDRRNNTLVMHLQQNGITDKEAINKYLEQYDSWKNAKKEWKDNTLNNLTLLIDKNNKDKETKEKEQEKNKKEQKKNDNKDKKDDTLYDKNGNTVGSKWTPSNDDSINGVEDEYIYDKNGNKVGSKAKTEKKKDNKKNVDMNKILPNSAVIKQLLNIKKSK